MANTTWDNYINYLTINGNSAAQRTLASLQSDYELLMPDNPSYIATAKRNGVTQGCMITRSDDPYKANIVVNPGDDLAVGDDIEAFGEHWLVLEASPMNTFQIKGLMRVCNHLFKWQNHSTTVNEVWGIFDSSTYTSTISGSTNIQFSDRQAQVYLPLNDVTKRLYINKRLAVGTMFDENDEEILAVFDITDVAAVGESYGQHGHLLSIQVRSGKYNDSTDNLVLGLCDYIQSDNSGTSAGTLLKCAIIGRTAIGIGMKRTYTAAMYEVDGVTPDTTITPVWSTTPEVTGITASVSNNVLSISVANDEELIGTVVTVNLTDANALYDTAVLNVGVVS